jgi:hypothetical protein
MMLQPTLLISAIFAIASAGIYFYVGNRLARRRIASAEARLAWTLFVVWWYALAATTLAGGVLNLLGVFAVTDLALFVTFTYVNLLAICVGLYGLLYYLLYLFTGNQRLLTPLTLFYIGYCILLVYFITYRNPIGLQIGRWSTTLQYERPLTGPLFVLVLVLLVFPQIIGSLAYFSFFFRVQDPTQKYRVALVSWSIIIWFGSALLASIAGLSQQEWWQIVSRLIGLGAALAILLAYEPVRWIKQRLGVASITDEAAA